MVLAQTRSARLGQRFTVFLNSTGGTTSIEFTEVGHALQPLAQPLVNRQGNLVYSQPYGSIKKSIGVCQESEDCYERRRRTSNYIGRSARPTR